MRIHDLIKVFILVVSLQFVFAPKATAQMDPRAEVMLSVIGYGTAAGALLGVASLAFGTEARSIAMGASLGLYAGIIFGSYIVLSHAYNEANPDTSLYPEGDGLYQLNGGGDQALYWEDMRVQELKDDYKVKYFQGDKVEAVPFYINIFNVTF